MNLSEARLITATYRRQVYDAVSGAWLNEVPVEISAEVIQDGGHGCSSELCVIWTDSTLETFQAGDFDIEELIGAQEAIEEAWFVAERAACAESSVKQRSEVAA